MTVRGFSSKLPPPALAIAVAVFAVAAVGGSAIAGGPDAARSRQVSGSKLKSRSVSGRKLKRNTLTGVEVNESRLGAVPLATNANALGGKPAGGYVPASKVLTSGSLVRFGAGETKTLLSKGPLKIQGVCVNTGGANRRFDLVFTTTEAGSALTFVLGAPTAVNPGPGHTQILAGPGATLAGISLPYTYQSASGTSLDGSLSGFVNAFGADCAATATGIG